MPKEYSKEVLNHPCTNCPHLEVYIGRGCSCSITKQRINFLTATNQCIKLYMIKQELESPHYEEDDYLALKNGEIVCITSRYFNHERNEYKYLCSKVDKEKPWYHTFHEEIFQSDILQKVYRINNEIVYQGEKINEE